jgi:hypothetical protein
MSNPDRTNVAEKRARRRAFNVIPAVEDVDDEENDWLE